MPSKSSRNEQRKLTAAFLNGIAIAMFAVGAIGLVVSLSIGTTFIGAAPLSVAAVCIIASGILHWGGRSMLRGIEE